MSRSNSDRCQRHYARIVHKHADYQFITRAIVVSFIAFVCFFKMHVFQHSKLQAGVFENRVYLVHFVLRQATSSPLPGVASLSSYLRVAAFKGLGLRFPLTFAGLAPAPSCMAERHRLEAPESRSTCRHDELHGAWSDMPQEPSKKRCKDALEPYKEGMQAFNNQTVEPVAHEGHHARVELRSPTPRLNSIVTRLRASMDSA